jgi:hypothetical protein
LPTGIFPPSVPENYWGLFSPKGPLDPSVDLSNIVTNYLRAIATVFYIASLYFYECYREHCGHKRWKQPNHRLGIRSQLIDSRKWWNVLEWLAFPIFTVIYVVIPSYHAQLIQLVTDRLDYVVAAKPSFVASQNSKTHLGGDGNQIELIVGKVRDDHPIVAAVGIDIDKEPGHSQVALSS